MISAKHTNSEESGSQQSKCFAGKNRSTTEFVMKKGYMHRSLPTQQCSIVLTYDCIASRFQK